MRQKKYISDILLVQSSRVTGLFTGQYNTEVNGTFTGFVYSFGGSIIRKRKYIQ